MLCCIQRESAHGKVSVELLLESGADTRPRDKQGDTALDIARSKSDFSKLNILQEHMAKHPEQHPPR